LYYTELIINSVYLLYMSHISSGSRTSDSSVGQVLGVSTPAGSVTPGQVLGAVTGLGAGAEILPRTGVGSVIFFLVLASMIAAALVVLSFLATRAIKAWF
jgi:hypothetical protein